MVSALYDKVIASTLVRLAAAQTLVASSSCSSHLLSASAAASLITVCAVLGAALIGIVALFFHRQKTTDKYVVLESSDGNIEKALLY